MHLSATDASPNLLRCRANFNRRAKECVDNDNQILYLYDGWQVVEEREWDENGESEEDDAWEARRQYVYGGV